MRERAALLGLEASQPAAAEPSRVDAIVLKVNSASARMRLFGEAGELTFRATRLWHWVPGHLVTLIIERCWIWRGHPYASGTFENPRIDIARLELKPLPLTGGGLIDLREESDALDDDHPYAPLWNKYTATPRADFEMDDIAWGQFPGADEEDNLTCDAAELAEAGDHAGARELLMKALTIDLRCVDAHAHLGNREFDLDPRVAAASYEIGMRIAELSLPPKFDGLLRWVHINNRPYLRCLHGYGLCLWRMGQLPEAAAVFERMLRLNPDDNQGARFLLENVQSGRSWTAD
jgi:tetratricopeptide (TPR) repeat protein